MVHPAVHAAPCVTSVSNKKGFVASSVPLAALHLSVKGGVKLDQWGGEKVDQSTGWMGLSLKDLRGWRERRPANRLAGRV